MSTRDVIALALITGFVLGIAEVRDVYSAQDPPPARPQVTTSAR
ncbi:hypothetical protein [Wenjunlia vitaminophila]|nr:hypothetical protein [Wenjunlia vitaminophila]